MNHALHFWTSHNAMIIQWLLAFICGLSIVLIFRVVVRKKSDHDDMKVPDLSNIEASLKKIIESSVGSAAKPAGGVAGTADPNMAADLQNLKNALAEKAAEIEKLKASAEAAPAADNGLADKVRDLEAKLAEYQILEDDIADLTRYKKENEELKAKLGGAPAAAEAAPSPTEAVAPTPEATAPASAEAAPAPAAEAAAPTPEAAPAAEAAPVAPAAPGPDLVAEFQATVQEQKKAEGNDLLAEFSTEQKSS